MSTTTTHLTETARAIAATAALAETVASGALANQPRLAHPLPIAFLDDGRRLFLVVDAGTHRPADAPRSWGVEVARDGDLVGDAPGDRTAVRSTRRLTGAAAAQAAEFVLDLSAD